jgi:GTP-binding protein
MSAYPDVHFMTSAYEPAQLLADSGLEVAVAGRSNAGKSSAINAIVGRKGLARTSKTPGRTQMINFFSIGAERRLVDLPGYGYARVSAPVKRHWQGLMEHYFAQRQSLQALLLVVDIRRGLTDFDWQMMDWAAASERPVAIVLTKADKLRRGPAMDQRLKVRKSLDTDVPLVLFSAVTRQGVEEAQGWLNSWLQIARP